MKPVQSVYKSLLKEYEEKQLRAFTLSRYQLDRANEEVPGLRQITAQINSLRIKQVSAHLRGSSEDCEEKIRSLNLKREKLLKDAGYTLPDPESVYECPVCRDTGFTEDGPCSCFKARITDILYERSNMRRILEKENFSSFSLEYYSDEPLPGNPALSERKLAQKALDAVKSFCACFDDSDENLLISGGCGVGKTFLANCAAKEIIEHGGFVISLSAIKLFDILSGASFEKDPSRIELSKHIYECDLLIIDDLGTELSNSFTSMSLFDCINERLSERKHTMITTNLSARQLRDTYSERIFSRITNSYTMIKLLGSDIRVKKRLEN